MKCNEIWTVLFKFFFKHHFINNKNLFEKIIENYLAQNMIYLKKLDGFNTYHLKNANIIQKFSFVYK